MRALTASTMSEGTLSVTTLVDRTKSALPTGTTSSMYGSSLPAPSPPTQSSDVTRFSTSLMPNSHTATLVTRPSFPAGRLLYPSNLRQIKPKPALIGAENSLPAIRPSEPAIPGIRTVSFGSERSLLEVLASEPFLEPASFVPQSVPVVQTSKPSNGPTPHTVLVAAPANLPALRVKSFASMSQLNENASSSTNKLPTTRSTSNLTPEDRVGSIPLNSCLPMLPQHSTTSLPMMMMNSAPIWKPPVGLIAQPPVAHYPDPSIATSNFVASLIRPSNEPRNTSLTKDLPPLPSRVIVTVPNDADDLIKAEDVEPQDPIEVDTSPAAFTIEDIPSRPNILDSPYFPAQDVLALPTTPVSGRAVHIVRRPEDTDTMLNEIGK